MLMLMFISSKLLHTDNGLNRATLFPVRVSGVPSREERATGSGRNIHDVVAGHRFGARACFTRVCVLTE